MAFKIASRSESDTLSTSPKRRIAVLPEHVYGTSEAGMIAKPFAL